ncbi:hypothetical protein [Acinetobacter baumannii]|uniref:hypothetical protein n=1 Tax=Acinetobacter baumannii TaxID=470 RepID=UPI0033978B18
MQSKTDRLTQEAAKTGLEINTEKTETMSLHTDQQSPIEIRGKELKEVDTFVYFGSTVTATGGSDEDAKSRVGKARHVINTLRPIWRSTALTTTSKLRIFNSTVKTVLLYGSETWRVTRRLTPRLQVFTTSCLRHILKVSRADKVRNEVLKEASEPRADRPANISQKMEMGWAHPEETSG